MYKMIHLASIEDFIQCQERKRDFLIKQNVDYVESHNIGFVNKMKEREEALKDFPFQVVLEGAYTSHDFVTAWCWKNIGSHHGRCTEGGHSEYAGCPLVVATQHKITGWYPDANGKRVDWEELAYSDVPAHSHVGNWCSNWLGKNGYDYGFGEYYFQTEDDRNKFIAAIPIFETGEKEEEVLE